MTNFVDARMFPSRLTGLAFLLLTSAASAQTVAWTRQLGTSSDDRNYAVSADGLGFVYTAGATAGNLGGSNAGGLDAYVSKYDSNGVLVGTKQFGTSSDDVSRGVSADAL